MKKLAFARKLRRDSTDAERKLWARLRAHRFFSLKFKRNAPVGRYFADFVSFRAKVIIELDGGHHALQQDYDDDRDEWLKSRGFTILRFPDGLVLKDTDAVLEAIWVACGQPEGTCER